MITFIEEFGGSSSDCLNYLSNLEVVSLDTETTGIDCHTNKLLLMQVGDNHRQFVTDCTKIDISIFKEVLESKIVIMHNAKFDFRFLYKYGIDIKNIYDTFLVECILTTGLSDDDRDLSLKGVVQKYCNIQLDKQIRGVIHKEGNTERVLQYAADDIKYLSEVRDKQLLKIKELGLEKVLELENKVVRVFSLMEYNGIGFNSSGLKEVSAEIDKLYQELIIKLDNIIYTESKTNPKLKKYTQVQQDLFSDTRNTFINWSSPAQKTKILNELSLKVPDVAEKTLQKNKHKHPIIPLLLDYSKYAKLGSSFGTPLLTFINKETNRIHGSIWQILSSGRISMSEPNLQQIPSHSELGVKIKACFIPRKGCKFVSADYSQFELRIIAEYSQDPLWIKTFNEDKDLHSILCTETFDIPLEDVKKPFPGKPDISYRFLQKTLNFGLAYGMSKFKLSEVAQISVAEADKIIKRFFSKVPKVESFLNILAKAAVKNGYIRTDLYYRRIRWFKHLDLSDYGSVGRVERQAKNSIPQGCNANIVKQALIDLQEIIDDNKYPINIVLQIHDEICTECPDELVEIWEPILTSTMIKAAEKVIKSVPIKVDSVISDYWTD